MVADRDMADLVAQDHVKDPDSVLITRLTQLLLDRRRHIQATRFKDARHQCHAREHVPLRLGGHLPKAVVRIEGAVVAAQGLQVRLDQLEVMRLFSGDAHPVEIEILRHAGKAPASIEGEVDGVELDVRHRVHEGTATLCRAEGAPRDACGLHQRGPIRAPGHARRLGRRDIRIYFKLRALVPDQACRPHFGGRFRNPKGVERGLAKLHAGIVLGVGHDRGYDLRPAMAIYQLEEDSPVIPATAWVAESAAVIGRVKLGEHASVWYGATVRGDNEWIQIGERSNIQEGSVLHSDMGFPLSIGAGVTVGHQAMVHGCTIGDDSLIGIQAVVLNGARIGAHCLVGAGAVVTENKVFPDGSMILGAPARVVRQLTPEEIQRLRQSATHYVQNASRHREHVRRIG
jgi:carbonic anhydrase/acetyltransferase-like protein (isoleucine patch superfamily)